jgi:hypothetical protein
MTKLVKKIRMAKMTGIVEIDILNAKRLASFDFTKSRQNSKRKKAAKRPEAKSSFRRKNIRAGFLDSSSKKEAVIQISPTSVNRAKLLLARSFGFLRKTKSPRERSRKEMMKRRMIDALSIKWNCNMV